MKEASAAVAKLNLARLDKYTPAVVGSFPLGLQTPSSDIDIVFYAQDLSEFKDDVEAMYKTEENFCLRLCEKRDVPTIVVNFVAHGFAFEFFAQAVPITEQEAYLHLVVEQRLLQLGGERARNAIRSLKLGGMKTEPAFAKVFGLRGDPYLALLEASRLDEGELSNRIIKPS